MEIKKINGVIVAIIGLDKCNGYFRVYYTLNGWTGDTFNGWMFFDWVKKDLFAWVKRGGTKYKLQSTKTSFIADNYECYRHIVSIKDNVEYIEFLSSLYDYLQDYLKNCEGIELNANY